ncbi:MAG TPA: hypothetical protein VK001_00270, partial [Geminicoccaceae bacterium]|nr:hypothetical protein [Geminicoccaceae bacterium]
MATCPCDVRPFPPAPDIAAGLDRLPRQIAGFPEFRLALLAGISGQPALDAWRAREGDDFGLMMLEWWAYVLDVLAFYGSEIANELYLRTATRDASLRRLTDLIGYVPKPPLAASATLALFAEQGQPITVPAGTAFRSDAFDGEPPQIFESSADATIAGTLNAWTIQPIRPSTFENGPLLLDPRTVGVAEGQLVLLTWGGSRHPARVASIQPTRMLDGELYVQVELDPAPGIPSTQAVDDIRIRILPLRAGLSPFASNPVTQGGGSATLVLDALYPQLRAGAVVVVENTLSSGLYAAEVDQVSLEFVDVSESNGSGTKVPVTELVLVGDGPSWLGSATPAALSVHFGAANGGRVVRPARTHLGLEDLQPSAGLKGPVEPLQLATQSRVLLQDALEVGADLPGNVSDDGAGAATLVPLATGEPFGQLRTPVQVFGNLVAVTRGESVEEILGSGDGTQSFQRFRLTKKPLTYLPAPGTATGRQSTLEIWVGGVRWREVPSLFLAGPEDEVYTVRQTVDGATEVTFGGGGYGKPLPSGAGNVRARYRYGAGAASPPAGAIRQLARPVKGIRRALNPLAAFGGDDGDAGADIRKAAPNSALSLGRAVSLVDFEAIARGYRGILNAAAVMAWDEREQRAAVKVYFIPPTADEADQLRADLQAHLRAIAAP